MPFRVSGKNLDIGEALRERVSARIVEALSKYFDGGYSGHVTVEKEGFGFRTECAVHLDSGMTLHTEANAADAYASADQAALRIENRLRRYKRRLKDRHGARMDGAAVDVPSYVIETPTHEDDDGGDRLQSGHHCGVDDRPEAALGERGRDGTGPDRGAGRGIPPCQPRAGEPGLPPARRQCRMDRPAGCSPLTGSGGGYKPPPSHQQPHPFTPDRLQCRSPISSRRMRSFRRSK